MKETTMETYFVDTYTLTHPLTIQSAGGKMKIKTKLARLVKD